jgi:hypothetical protein
LLNIGGVIGEKFIIDAAVKEAKQISFDPNYRIDYDDEIGQHLNASLLIYDKKRGYIEKGWHSRFGEKIYDDQNKLIPQGQTAIQDKMILLTIDALTNKSLMNSDDALEFLRHFSMKAQDFPNLHNHFREFKIALRPLIEQACHAASMKFNISQVDYEAYHKRVTAVLHELDIPLGIEKLMEFNPRNLANKAAEIRLLTGELLYIESRGGYAKVRLDEVSQLLNEYDPQNLKLMFNYMKERARDEEAPRLHSIINILSNIELLEKFKNSLPTEFRQPQASSATISLSSQAGINIMLAGGSAQKAAKVIKSQIESTETNTVQTDNDNKQSQRPIPEDKKNDEPQNSNTNRPGM